MDLVRWQTSRRCAPPPLLREASARIIFTAHPMNKIGPGEERSVAGIAFQRSPKSWLGSSGGGPHPRTFDSPGRTRPSRGAFQSLPWSRRTAATCRRASTLPSGISRACCGSSRPATWPGDLSCGRQVPPYGSPVVAPTPISTDAMKAVAETSRRRPLPHRRRLFHQLLACCGGRIAAATGVMDRCHLCGETDVSMPATTGRATAPPALPARYWQNCVATAPPQLTACGVVAHARLHLGAARSRAIPSTYSPARTCGSSAFMPCTPGREQPRHPGFHAAQRR